VPTGADTAKGKKRSKARNAPKFDLRTWLFRMWVWTLRASTASAHTTHQCPSLQCAAIDLDGRHAAHEGWLQPQSYRLCSRYDGQNCV